jgi:hypothetical protein
MSKKAKKKKDTSQAWTKANIIGSLILVFIGAGSLLVAYKAFSVDRETRIENNIQSAKNDLLKAHRDDDSSSVDGSMIALEKAFDEKAGCKKENLQEAGCDREKRKKLRTEFAEQLTDFLQEGFIDFRQRGNLKLDSIAMNKWREEYSETLKRRVRANTKIIYYYSVALHNLRVESPDFVEKAKFLPNNSIDVFFQPKDPKDKEFLIAATYLYGKHAQLLQRNINEPADKAKDSQIKESICWYYDATNNPDLTIHTFPNDNVAEIIEGCDP